MLAYGEIPDKSRYEPNIIIISDNYAEILLYNKKLEEIARAIIDIETVGLVKDYQWHIQDKQHVSVKINSKTVYLHRLITNCPEDMVCDHINNNPLDNRKENLRICTVQQNGFNRKLNRNNTSGYSGVTWSGSRGKWRVGITVNQKVIALGSYVNLEDAVVARKKAEEKYFGDFRYKVGD